MEPDSCHLVTITNTMERKKFILQVAIAVVLYVAISLILENDFSKDIFLKELQDGLIFGLVYAVFLWVWNRNKKKNDS
jgi:predicted tellurium resistance membrane protein TerC